MNRSTAFLSLLACAGAALAQGTARPAEEVVDLQARKRIELRELLRAQRRVASPPSSPAGVQRQLTLAERAELRELLRRQSRQEARH